MDCCQSSIPRFLILQFLPSSACPCPFSSHCELELDISSRAVLWGIFYRTGKRGGGRNRSYCCDCTTIRSLDSLWIWKRFSDSDNISFLAQFFHKRCLIFLHTSVQCSYCSTANSTNRQNESHIQMENVQTVARSSSFAICSRDKHIEWQKIDAFWFSNFMWTTCWNIETDGKSQLMIWAKGQSELLNVLREESGSDLKWEQIIISFRNKEID